MLADQVSGEPEPLVAWYEFALGLEKVDETFGSKVLGGTSVKPWVGAELRPDIGEQTGPGVRLARIQHHLNDFVSVNLFHGPILANADRIDTGKQQMIDADQFSSGFAARPTARRRNHASPDDWFNVIGPKAKSM
jgi:hypothetical protein